MPAFLEPDRHRDHGDDHNDSDHCHQDLIDTKRCWFFIVFFAHKMSLIKLYFDGLRHLKGDSLDLSDFLRGGFFNAIDRAKFI